MFNIGLLTKEQWAKVFTALVFSFVSTTLAVFVAGGGIQNSFEATIALAAASTVAGINAALYALYITFFKKAE